MSGSYSAISELPETLAVFPLPGTLLFPRWKLPLNIFEPRYLNMIDDAMAGDRLLGMIQSLGGERANPVLAKVGCAGYISSYSETEDGRYLITLSGIARFRIAQELDDKTPYRKVHADFSGFDHDLIDPSEDDLPPRLRLEAALQIYVDQQKFEADWEAVQDADYETLVHALATGCPFRPIEKQALIETDTLKTRTETLIQLLSMSARQSGNEPNDGPPQ